MLYPVTADMRIYHEEQFGPVIPVAAFAEEQEVVEHVRDSSYGQQFSIFGSDALRVFSIRTTVATKSSESNRDLVTGIVRGLPVRRAWNR